MKRSTAAALIAAKIAFGATMALGLAHTAQAGPLPASPQVTQGIHDGQSAINEDDARWSCVDDGNHICGPGNTEGKPAGCYDEGGVLIARWPCHVVQLDPIGHPNDWDVEADPGSPDYDYGQTYGGWTLA